jgi:PDZ domain-containing secreted protein
MTGSMSQRLKLNFISIIIIIIIIIVIAIITLTYYVLGPVRIQN